MYESADRMTSYQRGDLWVKGLSAGAAVLVAVVALYIYNHKQSEEIEQRKKEYEIKFFEKKLAVYCELCEVVGIISKLDVPALHRLAANLGGSSS
jgi:hypothetical protein